MQDATDPFDVSMGMLTQCAAVALEQAVVNEDFLHAAAKARIAESIALIQMAAGRQYPFNPKLGPLIRAVNDFIKSVDVQINQPIDQAAVPEDQLMEIIAAREDAAASLDQARIAGIALLVHLSAAIPKK